MGKTGTKSKLGCRFGRPDIERCDLFYDLGFLDWEKYPEKLIEFNEASKKGVQMLSSVPDGGHKKCGIPSLSGYFDPDIRSIYIKDRYLEKWKIGGRPTPHPLRGPWIPGHPASKHSTPGDNYGTFTKVSEYKAFSPLTRIEKPDKRKKLKNFITNPGKKGNCGYPNIGINKYPPHTLDDKVDAYFAPELLCSAKWKKHKAEILYGPLKAGFYPRNFEENPYKDSSLQPTYVQREEKQYGKSRGTFFPSGFANFSGYSETGCFSKFPEWTPEPYMTAREAVKKLDKTFKPNLVFRPEPRLKSYYTVSVVNNKIDLACNKRTWRTMVKLGDLLVTLSFLQSAERLTVVVNEARNLRVIDDSRLSSDPFVKVSFIQDGKRVKKKKTSVQRNDLNPVFNESVTFDVLKENLPNVSIEFSVYHDNKFGPDEFLGKAMVGLCSSCQLEEVKLFKKLLGSKTAVSKWLILRDSE